MKRYIIIPNKFPPSPRTVSLFQREEEEKKITIHHFCFKPFSVRCVYGCCQCFCVSQFCCLILFSEDKLGDDDTK